MARLVQCLKCHVVRLPKNVMIFVQMFAPWTMFYFFFIFIITWLHSHLFKKNTFLLFNMVTPLHVNLSWKWHTWYSCFKLDSSNVFYCPHIVIFHWPKYFRDWWLICNMQPDAKINLQSQVSFLNQQPPYHLIQFISSQNTSRKCTPVVTSDFVSRAFGLKSLKFLYLKRNLRVSEIVARIYGWMHLCSHSYT